MPRFVAPYDVLDQRERSRGGCRWGFPSRLRCLSPKRATRFPKVNIARTEVRGFPRTTRSRDLQSEHWVTGSSRPGCRVPEPIYIHPEPEGSPGRRLALPATRGAAVNQPGPCGFRLTGHRTALRHGSLTVQYARRFTGSWPACSEPNWGEHSAVPPRCHQRGFPAQESL